MTPLLERDFSKGVTVTKNRGNGSSESRVFYSKDELIAYSDVAGEVAVDGAGMASAPASVAPMLTAEEIANYHLTAEEVDAVRRAIAGAEKVLDYGARKISEIISEETGAFASGAKSAGETAAIIQSRARLFVSESM
jgi:hypothetical protein